MTPLHWAAYNGRTPVVELLIKLGASVEALDYVNYIYLYEFIQICTFM